MNNYNGFFILSIILTGSIQASDIKTQSSEHKELLHHFDTEIHKLEFQQSNLLSILKHMRYPQKCTDIMPKEGHHVLKEDDLQQNTNDLTVTIASRGYVSHDKTIIVERTIPHVIIPKTPSANLDYHYGNAALTCFTLSIMQKSNSESCFCSASSHNAEYFSCSFDQNLRTLIFSDGSQPKHFKKIPFLSKILELMQNSKYRPLYFKSSQGQEYPTITSASISIFGTDQYLSFDDILNRHLSLIRSWRQQQLAILYEPAITELLNKRNHVPNIPHIFTIKDQEVSDFLQNKKELNN